MWSLFHEFWKPHFQEILDFEITFMCKIVDIFSGKENASNTFMVVATELKICSIHRPNVRPDAHPWPRDHVHYGFSLLFANIPQWEVLKLARHTFQEIFQFTDSFQSQYNFITIDYVISKCRKNLILYMVNLVTRYLPKITDVFA